MRFQSRIGNAEFTIRSEVFPSGMRASTVYYRGMNNGKKALIERRAEADSLWDALEFVNFLHFGCWCEPSMGYTGTKCEFGEKCGAR